MLLYKEKKFSNMKKSLIFAAPSGCGKTTLARKLVELFILYLDIPLAFSVSTTCRPKRGNEQEGVDYYFVTPEKFQEMIDNREFAEWQEVYEGGFYGTTKAEIARMHTLGKIPVFDIDVEGAKNMKKIYGKKVKFIFIEPPSLVELERRLRDRNTDSEEEIVKRLAKASHELEQKKYADTCVVNDDFQEALFDSIHIAVKFLNFRKNSAAFGQMIYDLFKEKHNNTLVLITGITNCGKTTQGKLLKEKCFPNARVADSGDLVRTYLNSDDIDPEDKKKHDSGQVINPEKVAALWMAHLKKAFRAGRMIILSGSPRTMAEAGIILRECDKYKYRIVCLTIDISENEAVRRLLERNKTSGRIDTLDKNSIRKKLDQSGDMKRGKYCLNQSEIAILRNVDGTQSIPYVTVGMNDAIKSAVKEKKLLRIG